MNNLPAGLTEPDLREIFATVGPVSEARIRDGRGGAWGLVVFDGPYAARNAATAVRDFDRAAVNGTEISVVLDQGPPPATRW